MKLATAAFDDREEACILTPRGLIPIAAVNRRCSAHWPTDLFHLLATEALEGLQAWYTGTGQNTLEVLPEAEIVPTAAVRWRPPYHHPRKIWGIGLNYRAHAADLSESAPQGIPASFMKPDTALIGPGDAIEIPTLSERTTAEAELGVIIGRRCRHVAPGDWLKVVAGFTPVIDMTAEDILRQNPRYLTLAKSFDTFFSFGPVVLTPDEVPDVSRLEVATVVNGGVHAANAVANMTFAPDFLVAFHSRVMTLLPGDILSTGTPGAAMIRDGDLVEARITGFPALANPVRDLKAAPHPGT
ncbi:MAG: fumarylacetoacetate hydrolase family protein [Desulfobacteraceae bacterium]|nr:fumarylacetoacetate hydrolase family protein [Desulfobacteraceae bacterium]